MKKIKNLPESDFLKWVFGIWTAAFLIAAACMPDRGSMGTGFARILMSPCKLSTNYFSVGGYAATFLNVGLVSLVFLGMILLFRVQPGKVSVLAFLLTSGFCFWGINVLNIWFPVLGVLLYCLVKKEKPASQMNAMLFSTGVTPLISELMLRYPYGEVVGFHFSGVLIALAVGLSVGFFLPAGLTHSPAVHKGFDLYSAALPVGMMTFFFNALLYKTMGLSVPAGPDASTYAVASGVIVNGFFGALFVLCIAGAFLLGCRPKDYWKLLRGPKPESTVAGTYGNGIFLMNMGLYGLFILAYYNLVGASFNAITAGIILCMLSCCNDGSHPGNVWPILLGYGAASWLCGILSGAVGGTFSGAIHAQGLLVGLCFASGLSPISSRYGWQYGFLASIMHYLLVTSVPAIHGGFCLYNGGFTAALICLILIPELERFVGTKKAEKK